MSKILDKIIKYKRKELQEKKELFPVKGLEKSIYFETPVVSLSEYLLREDKVGVIAEIKRKSPSKGMIHEYVDIEKISIGYMQAGASAISVLTDEHFFGGSSDYLTQARHFNYCPILRKDFIFDEYQILEAKSIGADAILLIASVLNPEQLKKLASFAVNLGLEVLLEVHTVEEAQAHTNEFTKLVGVNNRNLDTFEVDIQTSVKLSKVISDDFVKVSESGINDPQNVVLLKKHGYQGFLMGEHFMQSANPHLRCKEFIKELKKLEEEAMKIKVCGMKYAENILAVAELKPDFMGFIFYDRSPRFALTELEQTQISNLPDQITKVGVFVDEDFKDVVQICSEYKIKMVQLHGTESPDFCRELKNAGLKIIKAFGVDENSDFEITKTYSDVVDCFLFDTKSLAHGGSGKTFDWALIKGYKLDMPYFLSGGIGLEHLSEIKKMNDSRLMAIDVNSQFEIKPGMKNISALQILFKEIKNEI